MKYETKDNILSLAVAFPDACSKVIEKFIRSGEGLYKFSVVCDIIGIDYCRHIFDRIPLGQWQAVEDVIKNTMGNLDSDKQSQILSDVYKTLLAESMDWEDGKLKHDIFEFLRGLDTHEVSSLLQGEDPTHIAFISLYWNLDEFMEFLNSLDSQQRKLTILQMSRLDRLPETALLAAAERFAESLLQKRVLQDVQKNRVTPPPYPTVGVTPPPYPNVYLETYAPNDSSIQANKDSVPSLLQTRPPSLDDLRKKSARLVQELRRIRDTVRGYDETFGHLEGDASTSNQSNREARTFKSNPEVEN